MLDGLQTEIDKYPVLTNAGAKAVMAKLNEPGSALVESWVTNPNEALYTVNEVYTYHISDESLGKLIALLVMPEYVVLALRLDKATRFDLSSSFVLGMLSNLLAGEIITQAEHDNLVRLGQVKKSRAEELFERKLTVEDF
jgi:hypothetical protein